MVLLHYILCISLRNCDPNTPAPSAFLCYWLALFSPFIVVWVSISIICNQTVKVLNEESKRRLILDNDFGHSVWCHITTFVHFRINLILIVWTKVLRVFLTAKLRRDALKYLYSYINTTQMQKINSLWKRCSKYHWTVNLWHVLFIFVIYSYHTCSVAFYP